MATCFDKLCPCFRGSSSDNSGDLPIRNKRVEKGRFAKNLHYVSAAAQGWRPSMEDRYANHLHLESQARFFGVFDGHAGSHTAQMLSEHLYHIITENDEFASRDYITAITKGFINMDSRLSTDSRVQIDISGSTGVVVMVDSTDMLHVAWLGDSRAVISHNGVAQNLTIDHLPTNPEEYLRIKRANMFVSNDRVNGSLAMSRAFGDFIFKQHEGLSAEAQAVSCKPDIYHRKLDYARDEFIVLGSDGLWEMLDGQQVVDFVRGRLSGQLTSSSEKNSKSILENTCMDLIDLAVTDDIMNEEGVGCDNITATIILISSPAYETDQNNNKPDSKEPSVYQSFQHMIEPSVSSASKTKSKNKDNSLQVQGPNYRPLVISQENEIVVDNVNGSREIKRCDPAFDFPPSLYKDLSRKCGRARVSNQVPKLYFNNERDDYV